MRTVKKPMAPVKPCSAAAGEPNDSVLYTFTAVRDSPVASIFTSAAVLVRRASARTTLLLPRVVVVHWCSSPLTRKSSLYFQYCTTAG